MKRFLLYLIIIGFHGQLQAQINDFEVWAGTELIYDISKKYTLSVEEEFRFFDNAMRLLEQHNSIKLGCNIYKWLKLSVSYRFSKENNRYHIFENQHRFTFDTRIRKTIGRFRLLYRLRYQQSYSSIFSSENGKIPNYTIRNRITVRYNIPDFKGAPFAQFEYFYPLCRTNNFYKYETTLGFKYSLLKKTDAVIWYAFRNDRWQNIPLKRNIIGIAIQYEL